MLKTTLRPLFVGPILSEKTLPNTSKKKDEIFLITVFLLRVGQQVNNGKFIVQVHRSRELTVFVKFDRVPGYTQLTLLDTRYGTQSVTSLFLFKL